jgi:hypothetical protein|tara:strand:+ start:186 stop:566 length:381 start_codon:yes stop_codon:yes gene_type:complete
MESIKNIDIRHFKLTNNEDLICYVQSSSDHAFIVERPAVVRVSLDGTFTFGDWFPFSDKKVFKIMKRFVINHTEVVEETKESYIKYSCQDMIRDEINRDIKEYELEGEAMIEDDIRTEGTIEPTIH